MADWTQEAKEKISYDPLRVVWVERSFYEPEFEHYRQHNLDFMKEIKANLGYQAAMNIFSLIQDGGKYVVQAEWFQERVPVKAGRAPGHFYMPEQRMGYRGFITAVHRERWTVKEFEPTLQTIVPMLPKYRTPTWGEIKKGVWRKLEETYRPTNMMRWGFREIVARILYLPEVNPDHWGVKEF